MNRRGFLTTCASLLPLPAFVKAASLWLPPERPRIVDPDGFQWSDVDPHVDFVSDGPGLDFKCAVPKRWVFAGTSDGLTFYYPEGQTLDLCSYDELCKSMAHYEYDSKTGRLSRVEGK